MTKTNRKSQEVLQQEENLRLVLNSLYVAYTKHRKPHTFLVERGYLIYKIVDNCKITKQIAEKYLGILESRDLVRRDKETIEFYPHKYEKVYKQEVEAVFNEIEQLKGGGEK